MTAGMRQRRRVGGDQSGEGGSGSNPGCTLQDSHVLGKPKEFPLQGRGRRTTFLGFDLVETSKYKAPFTRPGSSIQLIMGRLQGNWLIEEYCPISETAKALRLSLATLHERHGAWTSTRHVSHELAQLVPTHVTPERRELVGTKRSRSKRKFEQFIRKKLSGWVEQSYALTKELCGEIQDQGPIRDLSRMQEGATVTLGKTPFWRGLDTETGKPEGIILKNTQSRYSHSSMADKMYKDLKNINWWTRMKEDFGGNWDDHLPLVNFPTTIATTLASKCAAYEALYARKKCSVPASVWVEVGDSQLTGPSLSRKQLTKWLDRYRLKLLRDRQKIMLTTVENRWKIPSGR
ncbi:hypothetical protein OSB04_un000853 [Centaurea solstitialis]|uniref:Uncharacterized protein n=1 Tax=Centaurea solstitialis TaxID=347529 RepID=A0AA38W367_9ASTR|nr:hypothetical protein OSB04_un000853 [Centaurea solstitialis]